MGRVMVTVPAPHTLADLCSVHSDDGKYKMVDRVMGDNPASRPDCLYTNSETISY